MIHYVFARRLFFLAVFIFGMSVFYSLNALAQGFPNDGVALVPAAVNNTSFAGMLPFEVAVWDQIPYIDKIVSEQKTTMVNQMAVGDVGKPAWLTIPKIQVNARVEHIGLTTEGAVGVPDGAFDVSWFKVGPRPGQTGSAVISGHTGIWKDGTHSVFDLLHTLTVGDEIHVKDDAGAVRTFVIKKTRIYGKDETVPEIFNKTDGKYLNIITCHGQYLKSQKTYSQRFVVFAELQ